MGAMRFLKKRALVVGGSGGIGAEVSKTLAGEGAQLVIHGSASSGKADRLAAKLRREGADVEALPLDVVVDRIDRALAAFRCAGPFDILVVCYGPIRYAPFAESDLSVWVQAAILNLALPGALISAFAPQMADRGFGRIVCFGGTKTDQVRGFHRIPAYSAAKTGLSSIVRSAAYEFGARNVLTNAVIPGYIATEYSASADGRPEATGGQMSARWVAALAADLASPTNETINGALVRADAAVLPQRA